MSTSQTLSRWALALAALGLLSIPAQAQVKKHKFYFPDKAPVVTDDEEVTTKVIVGDKDSEGEYTVISDLWKPTFKVATHHHTKHSETFYLLSGEAEWTVNGETHAMKAGDAVYIPVGAPHSTRTLGGKPAHFILIYSHGDYEAHLLRQKEYGPEKLKDPAIRKLMRELNDFNPGWPADFPKELRKEAKEISAK